MVVPLSRGRPVKSSDVALRHERIRRGGDDPDPDRPRGGLLPHHRLPRAGRRGARCAGRTPRAASETARGGVLRARQERPSAGPRMLHSLLARHPDRWGLRLDLWDPWTIRADSLYLATVWDRLSRLAAAVPGGALRAPARPGSSAGQPVLHLVHGPLAGPHRPVPRRHPPAPHG